jgi:hypothetical protein
MRGGAGAECLHALTLPFPLTLAWRGYAAAAEVVELSAAGLTHDDPEFSAKLDVCERALAAFITALEEWPEEITMSSTLQQRAKLSLAMQQCWNA